MAKKKTGQQTVKGEKVKKSAEPERGQVQEPEKAKAPKKEKKLSALDAAAKVLGESDQPMGCNEMIEAMAKKSYWSSPDGQTPAATLYSAILRELKKKGAESRFKKTERGKFALVLRKVGPRLATVRPQGPLAGPFSLGWPRLANPGRTTRRAQTWAFPTGNGRTNRGP